MQLGVDRRLEHAGHPVGEPVEVVELRGRVAPRQSERCPGLRIVGWTNDSVSQPGAQLGAQGVDRCRVRIDELGDLLALGGTSGRGPARIEVEVAKDAQNLVPVSYTHLR